MQISGLFKSLIPKLKTSGQKTSLLNSVSKADKLVFSSVAAFMEYKFNNLAHSVKGQVDKSIVDEGITLAKKYMEHLNIENLPDITINEIAEYKINNVEENFYNLKIRYMADKLSTGRHLLKAGFAEIWKNYKKEAPLNLFKSQLIDLVSLVKNPMLLSKNDPEHVIYEKIKYLGLPDDIVKLTKEIEKETNVDILPCKDKKLLTMLKEELSIHKLAYKTLPHSVSLIESNYFMNHPQLDFAKALYVLAKSKKTGKYSQIFMSYNQNFIHSFNNVYSNLRKSLKHELGHYLHYMDLKKIRKSFIWALNKNERTLVRSLTPEKVDLSGIKNKKSREKIKDILSIDIRTNPKKIFDKINLLAQIVEFLNLSKEKQASLLEINEKLQTINTIIQNHYPLSEVPDPRELVAEAFAHSNEITPSNGMQILLDFFNMPELKDRSYLPKDHPVMQLLGGKECK